MMNIVETSIGCPSASTWNRAILRHIGEVQDELGNNFFSRNARRPEDLCQGLSCVREPRRMRCLLTYVCLLPDQTIYSSTVRLFSPSFEYGRRARSHTAHHAFAQPRLGPHHCFQVIHHGVDPDLASGRAAGSTSLVIHRNDREMQLIP
jgi:hypothetical protein